MLGVVVCSAWLGGGLGCCAWLGGGLSDMAPGPFMTGLRREYQKTLGSGSDSPSALGGFAFMYVFGTYAW